jgi:hypothetical protein
MTRPRACLLASALAAVVALIVPSLGQAVVNAKLGTWVGESSRGSGGQASLGLERWTTTVDTGQGTKIVDSYLRVANLRISAEGSGCTYPPMPVGGEDGFSWVGTHDEAVVGEINSPTTITIIVGGVPLHCDGARDITAIFTLHPALRRRHR